MINEYSAHWCTVLFEEMKSKVLSCEASFAGEATQYCGVHRYDKWINEIITLKLIYCQLYVTKQCNKISERQ
jgi:hypothetical protein